jgi:hypothetical protein
MNWDRVEAARQRGKMLFAIAGFAILVAVLLLIAGPRFGDPMISTPRHEEQIPTSLMPYAIGFGGVLFGLAWMWRIYKAPTKHEGAHWRFRDH